MDVPKDLFVRCAFLIVLRGFCRMSDLERRKKPQFAVLEEQEESQSLAELVRVWEELEKEGKLVEVQMCPKCKSP